MPSPKTYRGPSRKLVLAFDVGTTYSGVSYCILDPGEVPKINGVSKYPAQDDGRGDNKIPSILYYDRQGAVKAVGAEALRQHIIEKAKARNWIKLEWWKLHLRAKHLASSHVRDEDIPPLPRGKSAVQVLGDFIRYLFSCARRFIIESHASGALLWDSVRSNIEFIITHPNGWEGFQQQQIREAAVIAGLVPDGEERSDRIHLLTEGEASLYFCITHDLARNSLFTLPIVGSNRSEQHGIIIIDAGGGTIDLSAYSVKLSPPRGVKEIAPAECRLQGSVFVTQRAHTFLKSKLANSRYGSPDIVQDMKEIFDRETKLTFHDAHDPGYIKFGTPRDKEPEYNIRSGQLTLAGEDIAKFFEPSVTAIADAFEKQRRAASELQIEVEHAFLVGGYAANDFLYRRLQRHPAFSNVQLSRPPRQVNKAVADGAVSSYIDPLVTSRTSKYTYGIKCSVRYNASLADHKKRGHKKFVDIKGDMMLPTGFQPILKKGVHVSKQQEFSYPFSSYGTSQSELSKMKQPILAYRGDHSDPKWVDDEPGRFTTIGHVIADTSKLAYSLPVQRTSGGRVYYRLKFDVVLLFGLTEFKAEISWKYKGEEKRSPASIVYGE